MDLSPADVRRVRATVRAAVMATLPDLVRCALGQPTSTGRARPPWPKQQARTLLTRHGFVRASDFDRYPPEELTIYLDGSANVPDPTPDDDETGEERPDAVRPIDVRSPRVPLPPTDDVTDG